MSLDNPIEYIRPTRQRRTTLELPPEVNSLSDLIEMAQTGKRYENIDNEMLWRISVQLIDINDMIGMEKLKQSIFFHVVYHLMELYTDDGDYLHTVIMGPPGSGKCLEKDTKILMYNGELKSVQDIVVGELLMGDDSTSRTVLSICMGNEEMYEISSQDSNHPDDAYGVNKSHILSLVKTTDDTFHDIPLEDFLNGSKSFDDYLGYKTSVVLSDNISMNIDPYILGFSVSRYFRLHDMVVLQLSDQKVIDYFLLSDSITYIGGYNYELHLNEYMECFIDKTHGVLPRNYTKFPHHILKSILAGINDAIGEVDGSHTVLYFTHDSCDLFYNVKTICNILGVNYSCIINDVSYAIIGIESKKRHYILTIHDFTQHIPSVIHNYPFIESNMRSIVPYSINMKAVGKKDYYGFEIDGNGRFVLGNYTVTHNTTIAKIIGEMYKNMGILSADGIFKVAKREDFVAEYLGQTAVKTKKLLESCIGGVLFIDEVYALGPGKKDHDSFSKEAIDTLNVFLSEHSSSFCCIIAGYEEDIKNCFFSVNQGLERRFQWVHRIEKYSIEQLAQMFIKILTDIRWKKDASLTIELITRELNEHKEMFNSFGGDIENLITKCKMAHAKRIINMRNPKKHVITIDDLRLAIELMKPNSLKEEADLSYVLTMYI